MDKNTKLSQYLLQMIQASEVYFTGSCNGVVNSDGTINVTRQNDNSVNAIAANITGSGDCSVFLVEGQYYAFSTVVNKVESEAIAINRRSKKKEELTGKVKTLFYIWSDNVNVVGGKNLDIYFGGDRPKPIKVITIPFTEEQVSTNGYPVIYSNDNGYITNLGANKYLAWLKIQFSKLEPTNYFFRNNKLKDFVVIATPIGGHEYKDYSSSFIFHFPPGDLITSQFRYYLGRGAWVCFSSFPSNSAGGGEYFLSNSSQELSSDIITVVDSNIYTGSASATTTMLLDSRNIPLRYPQVDYHSTTLMSDNYSGHFDYTRDFVSDSYFRDENYSEYREENYIDKYSGISLIYKTSNGYIEQDFSATQTIKSKTNEIYAVADVAAIERNVLTLKYEVLDNNNEKQQKEIILDRESFNLLGFTITYTIYSFENIVIDVLSGGSYQGGLGENSVGYSVLSFQSTSTHLYQSIEIIDNNIYCIVSIVKAIASIKQWKILDNGKVEFVREFATPYYKPPNQSMILNSSFHP